MNQIVPNIDKSVRAMSPTMVSLDLRQFAAVSWNISVDALSSQSYRYPIAFCSTTFGPYCTKSQPFERRLGEDHAYFRFYAFVAPQVPMHHLGYGVV